MANPLYKYNPDKLCYEPVKRDPWHLFTRGGFQFAAGLSIGVILLLLGIKIHDSPTELRLKRQNQELTDQYEKMEGELDHMKNTLADIRKRDDKLYRTILQIEPIAPQVRKAGVGGAKRYEHLKNLERANLVLETKKKMDKVAKKLSIQARSFDELIKLARKKKDLLASVPAVQPISSSKVDRIAAGYGMRLHPIYNKRKMHHGIDFTADIGTKVRVTGEGIVTEVKRKRKGYGVNVLVNHGHGYKTRYAHLNKISTSPGDTVERGEVIGQVGNTGTSTGPHLHYEVIRNGNPVDPTHFFFQDLNPKEYEKVVEATQKRADSL